MICKEGGTRIIQANIDHLKFEYNHLQYIHTIRFFRKFSKYNKFLSNQ